MGLVRDLYGMCKGFALGSHGICMGFGRVSHGMCLGIPMEFARGPHGICKGFVRELQGVPLGLILDLHGFPMGFVPREIAKIMQGVYGEPVCNSWATLAPPVGSTPLSPCGWRSFFPQGGSCP